MNDFKEISPEALRKNPFQLIGKEWMLVTAGNEEKVNTMTASWGGLGVMYGKNVAFIVIRPQRYTKEFVDREETFSLSFFDKQYKKVLNYLGTVSGRNEDKIAKSGLTVVDAHETPFFDEANLVMICKKLFKQPLITDGLLDEKLKNTWYANGDNHTLYIAEITQVFKRKQI
ncbi:flavin reductase [Mobilitalea sibirica]|uniref:Flavin reductase n=1 Tax=Mobilitalea sibirica TaxID=1462919 RepID=A0A8J7H203_9FIRM|nr:flavin reductase [Mobilitalea sibirica]MBH1940664.1 flavin reductase [Mobilitalea sibirica]